MNGSEFLFLSLLKHLLCGIESNRLLYRRSGRDDVVKVLIEQGADVKLSRNIHGSTLLHAAANKGTNQVEFQTENFHTKNENCQSN